MLEKFIFSTEALGTDFKVRFAATRVSSLGDEGVGRFVRECVGSVERLKPDCQFVRWVLTVSVVGCSGRKVRQKIARGLGLQVVKYYGLWSGPFVEWFELGLTGQRQLAGVRESSVVGVAS